MKFCAMCGQARYGGVHVCTAGSATGASGTGVPADGFARCIDCGAVMFVDDKPRMRCFTCFSKLTEKPQMPERNYIVICPSGQGNPPHVEFFETYEAAETRAIYRARNSSKRYDIYRLAAAAYIVPQQPLVNKVVRDEHGA